jgi:alkyl hydroperoxide reductase subunit D
VGPFDIGHGLVHIGVNPLQHFPLVRHDSGKLHVHNFYLLHLLLQAARFLRAARLASALEADMRAGLGEAAAAVISDATAAAGLMAMNTVYYRFRHMIGKESYASRPPRLRMQRMAKPATSSVDFELMSLACAALAGCEFCLQNHEAKIVAEGTSEESCHDCVRIAAVVAAAAVATDAGDDG